MHHPKSTIATAALLLILAGCNSDPAAPAKPDEKPIAAVEIPAKSGAQLWSENCSRCHNLRPPEYYSDAQWHVLVHHMRLRANIEGSEARAILEFLQASN